MELLKWFLMYAGILIVLFLIAYHLWFAFMETDKRQAIINAAFELQKKQPRRTMNVRTLYSALDEYNKLKVPAYKRRKQIRSTRTQAAGTRTIFSVDSTKLQQPSN